MQLIAVVTRVSAPGLDVDEDGVEWVHGDLNPAANVLGAASDGDDGPISGVHAD